MKSVLFVALLVALASPSSALPDDLITPEDVDLLQETAWGDAVERVNSLLAVGKDDKACADLAKSEKKTIQDSVKTNQKLLNGLPTGVDCKHEGQELVRTQKNEVKTKSRKLTKAKDALEKAGRAEIDFGKRTFLSIASTGACAIEKSDLKYVAAKGVYDAAQKKVVTATAEHKAAVKGYNEAVAAAKKQRKECECDVQKKHADAWKKANAANASNQKGWTRATNMLCVTGGTHYKDCKGSTAPTVKKPYIDNGAKNAECSTAKFFKFARTGKQTTTHPACANNNKANIKDTAECWEAAIATGLVPASYANCCTSKDMPRNSQNCRSCLSKNPRVEATWYGWNKPNRCVVALNEGRQTDVQTFGKKNNEIFKKWKDFDYFLCK